MIHSTQKTCQEISDTLADFQEMWDERLGLGRINIAKRCERRTAPDVRPINCAPYSDELKAREPEKI